MRAIQPYDLVITPDDYLALVLEIQNTDALVLVGNGLFTQYKLDALEGIEFYKNCGSPTSFTEAFTRPPPASPIRKPSLHRPNGDA
jgi:hypothetical protein